MQRPGLLGTISIVGGLLLAIPMAIIGIEFLAQGEQLLGFVFLGLASVVLLLPEFVIRRLPKPWTRVKERFGR